LKKIANGVTTLYLGKETEKKGAAWTNYLHLDARHNSTAGTSAITWLHRGHLATVWATTGVDGRGKGRAHYRPYGTQFNSTLGQSKGLLFDCPVAQRDRAPLERCTECALQRARMS
jgi:hypothetical protein